MIPPHKRKRRDPFALKNGSENVDDFRCAKFDPQCSPSYEICDFTEVCESRSCNVAWTNDTASGKLEVHFQGCWPDGDDLQLCNYDQCIADKPEKLNPNTFHCCCNKPMCNENFQYLPFKDYSTAQPRDLTKPPNTQTQGQNVFTVAIIALVPVCLIAITIFVCYWLYRRYKYSQSKQGHLDPPGHGNIYINFNVAASIQGKGCVLTQDIKLIEIKAKGRFGVVWRADFGGKMVAVKTFPQDEFSWLQEQKIYNTAGFKEHPNILTFLFAQEPGRAVEKEHCIVTEYATYGSLYDYLKAHIIQRDELLHISIGVMRGLAFLHEEHISSDHYKPSIVHRDFKSKNVLLKQNLIPCIADFGLALQCVHGKAPDSDMHGQVGTRRYMAPEVLEGATEFSAFAFRQIDVYAAALVIWELLSRTASNEGERVSDYKLPFETEVGLHPTIADMLTCVLHDKTRPKLKDSWRKDRALLGPLCESLDDMWDSEPEARLTAAGALERFEGLDKSATVVGLTTDAEDYSMPLLVQSQPQTVN